MGIYPPEGIHIDHVLIVGAGGEDQFSRHDPIFQYLFFVIEVKQKGVQGAVAL